MTPPEPSSIGDLAGRLSGTDLDLSHRGRLLIDLTRALGGRAQQWGARATLSGRWLAEVMVEEIAPHLPVRDVLTLQAHFGGLTGDQLAEALIKSASRTTAALGAAAGALAAVELAAPPLLLASPVQLAASTLAMVTVELKLVAELHVVYGKDPLGTRRQVALAYLMSWAAKKGLDARHGTPSLTAILSNAAQRQLRTRLLRRLGRNLSSFAPFLAGAVAAAELSRRETVSLGEALATDLRGSI